MKRTTVMRIFLLWHGWRAAVWWARMRLWAPHEFKRDYAEALMEWHNNQNRLIRDDLRHMENPTMLQP